MPLFGDLGLGGHDSRFRRPSARRLARDAAQRAAELPGAYDAGVQRAFDDLQRLGANLKREQQARERVPVVPRPLRRADDFDYHETADGREAHQEWLDIRQRARDEALRQLGQVPPPRPPVDERSAAARVLDEQRTRREAAAERAPPIAPTPGSEHGPHWTALVGRGHQPDALRRPAPPASDSDALQRLRMLLAMNDGNAKRGRVHRTASVLWQLAPLADDLPGATRWLRRAHALGMQPYPYKQRRSLAARLLLGVGGLDAARRELARVAAATSTSAAPDVDLPRPAPAPTIVAISHGVPHRSHGGSDHGRQ